MNALGSATPLEDLVAESHRVLAAARARNVAVRLTGGLAIRLLCPAAAKPPLRRAYADLDLAVAGHGGNKTLNELMASLGYQAEEMFNALNGGTRLRYNDNVNGRHADVFVDAVRMCHVIEFKHRLLLLEDTLTPTDLLLTKLQIVELNDKDLTDAVALLVDQSLEAGASDAIDTAYLEEVWSGDWPLWRTSQLTLRKITRAMPAGLDAESTAQAVKSVAALEHVLESGRKSLRWRVRSRVGDRVRWYELPEDV